jgi:hypothetical protein
MRVYQLFGPGKEMGVAEVVTLLGDTMPRDTIKQALTRLMKLRLLDRVGQARGTRYRKSRGE